MQFSDVIRKQRAIRDFAHQFIDRTTIERLIGSAILAPSAMNLQPWAFAVVADRQKVDEFAKRAKEWLLTTLSTTSYEPSLRHMLENPNFSVFYHAPALVLVMAKASGTQAAEDCCLAAENFMLAARDEGLGTCWIGFARPWLDLPSIKAELGLPEQYHVVAPIIFGYPKEWPESPGRNPAEIHWLAENTSDYVRGADTVSAGHGGTTKKLSADRGDAGPVKLTVHCRCKKNFEVEYLNYQSILGSQVKCCQCGREKIITQINAEDVWPADARARCA